MNESFDSIVLNSCSSGFTPVYFIQDPGVTVAKSYIVTPSVQQVQKPAIDNLKSFYENSGNLERSLLINNVDKRPKTSLLKKQEVQIKNNIKIANYFVPKNNFTLNKESVTLMNNVILKPLTQVNAMKVNALPKITMQSKSMRIQCNEHLTKQTKITPKIKPKESPTTSTQPKLASLQLLGESYQSLDQQMKIVNQALKHISNTDNAPLNSTYDPVTNTRIVYKVVSPKDLKVVEKKSKKKVIIKEKKKDSRKSEQKCLVDLDEHETGQDPADETITRSGRKVKNPKQNLSPKDTTRPIKKKCGFSCYQCSQEFPSVFCLQKHYEANLSHIPANIHSNLFECLLAIIKTGPMDEKGNIFIQQLEHLITKIKSLLPCLLKKLDGTEGELCQINDDLGRIFGMNPGKYNLNIEALNCVKDSKGHCKHNPPKINQLNLEQAHLKHSHQNEEIDIIDDYDATNHAKFNSMANSPSTAKRIRKLKEKKAAVKKMRIASESLGYVGLESETLSNTEPSIDSCKTNSAINIQSKTESVDNKDNSVNIEQLVTIEDPETNIDIENKRVKPRGTHAEFYSAHFDIRSSPIKPSTTEFRKFQINPLKMTSFDSPNIQNLILDANECKASSQGIAMQSTDNNHLDINGILKDIDIQGNDVNNILASELNFDTNKDWDNPTDIPIKQTESNFVKTDSLFEPTLQSNGDNVNHRDDNMPPSNHVSNHGQSVLNFLDSLATDCLSYPDTEIRNSAVDFNLDLFSFSNA